MLESLQWIKDDGINVFISNQVPPKINTFIPSFCKLVLRKTRPLYISGCRMFILVKASEIQLPFCRLLSNSEESKALCLVLALPLLVFTSSPWSRFFFAQDQKNPCRFKQLLKTLLWSILAVIIFFNKNSNANMYILID